MIKLETASCFAVGFLSNLFCGFLLGGLVADEEDGVVTPGVLLEDALLPRSAFIFFLLTTES